MRFGKPWLASAFIILAFAQFAPADDTATVKTEPVDPSGSWQWEYSFNDIPAKFSLKLEWDGKELAGKYTTFNNTTGIEETKFTSDNKLSFISTRELNGNEFVVHFGGNMGEMDFAGERTPPEEMATTELAEHKTEE